MSKFDWIENWRLHYNLYFPTNNIILMNVLTSFAFDPDDSEETRLEKIAIFLVAGSCCIAGVVWTGMYYLIFGFGLTAILPLVFILIVGSSLVVSHFTKNHYYAIYAQILCIVYITAFIQWSIGGVFNSGFVLVWSFIGPITALMFFSLRQSVFWYVIFLINLVITVVFNDFFTSRGFDVPESIQILFFLMNLGIASLVVFIFAGYFVINAIAERQRANRLLLNVLPLKIAEILKTNNNTIADRFDSASVLFADIVGSTPLFAELEPTEAVDWLNQVYTMFDRLVEKYGLEKIRTIGDNYMVASGVPVTRSDHAKAIAQLSLDMIEHLNDFPDRYNKRIEIRIGINSGPLVAGVIGKSKFHYDVWGNTVNIASRMESHGEAGKIQISKDTYNHIKNEFYCVPRGEIEIKGRGRMETWFLVSKK